MTDDPLSIYFAGNKLYGDDFSPEEIHQWFEDEREGYANLGARNKSSYAYAYHEMNRQYGYRHLPPTRFSHVLSIGGAYGDELIPVLDRVERVTVLEPSDAFVVPDIRGVPATYVKPDPTGIMPFPDASFDLITCFGVLHHIPNVSTVVSEFARCIKPGGWLLVREPTTSMGDWRKPRQGGTKRERGIPLRVFRDIIGNAGLKVVRETRCGFPLVRRMALLRNESAYNSRQMVALDRALSALFRWQNVYHPTKLLHRFQGAVVYYVLRKD